jgi:predicted glycosyltransferase
MDFEHQPANHLAFRLAHTVLLPDAIPLESVRRQGASPDKVVRYPGLKEEIYLGDFEPDASILESMGIKRVEGEAIVVSRTPPTRALYHGPGNDLYIEALRALGDQSHVRIIVLPRHREQQAQLAQLALPNLTIPEAAVDSRSLIYSSDLFLGAGGTMTREAALLGVPTLSAFAGRRPAVDLALEDQGLLKALTDGGQIQGVGPRRDEPTPLHRLKERARIGSDAFLSAILGPGG